MGDLSRFDTCKTLLKTFSVINSHFKVFHWKILVFQGFQGHLVWFQGFQGFQGPTDTLFIGCLCLEEISLVICVYKMNFIGYLCI